VEQLRLEADAAERRRLWREATAMMLYVSIVLLAESRCSQQDMTRVERSMDQSVGN